VVITRADWRINGDLLSWIATTYPGLTNAQFEAGYRLLAAPGLSDAAAESVEVMLAGCVEARRGGGDDPES
jgi:hypothetical protein